MRERGGETDLDVKVTPDSQLASNETRCALPSDPLATYSVSEP